MDFHKPFMPSPERIARDKAVRRKHKIRFANLCFTESRDKKIARMDRPSLKTFIHKLTKQFTEYHGYAPLKAQVKLWKKQYRRLYRIKSCNQPIHDIPHIATKTKRVKKVYHKPKHKPDPDRILWLYGLGTDALRKEANKAIRSEESYEKQHFKDDSVKYSHMTGKVTVKPYEKPWINLITESAYENKKD